MAEYLLEDKITKIQVTKGILKNIWFITPPPKGTNVYIPRTIGKQIIEYVGDGVIPVGIGMLCAHNISDYDINLIFDDQIPHIKGNAFFNMKLHSLHFPTACDTIPDGCFHQSEISEISGLSNVRKICSSAFMSFRGIDCFEVPASCFIISNGAFAKSSISEIIGGENVKDVLPGAFQESSIRKISWFPKCDCIRTNTFMGCKSLKTVENIEHVSIIKGSAFSRSGLQKISWPAKCKIIPEKCFMECDNLKNVENIENVEMIDRYAFQSSGLTSFSFSQSLTRIAESAFAFTGLTEADLSVTCLERINNSAFYRTPAEKTITYPVGCIVEEKIPF